jgi:hypothetical protein
MIAFSFATPSRAVTPDSVDRAIAKSKEWLYKQQNSDGSWEVIPAREPKGDAWVVKGGQWGGTTALATYALLVAGEPHQDARIQKSVAFLKHAELIGTYAIAMRCQVWLSLPDTPERKQLLQKDYASLRSMMKTTGDAKGKYPYVPEGKSWSNSRTHFAVLGMWACAQGGIEVGDDYWNAIEQGWLRNQDASGAWCYYDKPEAKYPLSPGMTAGAVASLFVTPEYMHAQEGAGTRGNFRYTPIERGMKWLADHFDLVATDNPIEHDFPYVTLYAVERVGVASGYKFIGTHDWYDVGAAWLLKKQYSTGAFGSSVPNTSMGLIFLARGRAPLAMNKLDYTVDAKKAPPWNQRSRDVANVSRWIGRQIETPLNWQIVNLSATLEDLHEAPILYLSGNEAITLRAEDKAKLKQFVEEGGMIFGNADGGSIGFASSFS